MMSHIVETLLKGLRGQPFDDSEGLELLLEQ